MRKPLNLLLGALIGLLILVFLILPLSFGVLTRHYFHRALAGWAKTHPDASYQLKTLHHGLFSSTEQIEISFHGLSLLNTPFKLVYGPFIFDEGLSFGLAHIAKNTAEINGIPPTTYFGRIGFLGGILLHTHTPNPTQLLNLLQLILQKPMSFTLDSIDTELSSSLTSGTLDLTLSLNQFDFEQSPFSVKAEQINFILNDFETVHGDSSALASFNISRASLSDGLRQLDIPHFSISQYQVLASRWEAFSQLKTQVENFRSNNTDDRNELSRQAIEMILLGFNHQTQLEFSVAYHSSLGSGSFDLNIQFPKLPDNPSPNEILKHAKYHLNLGIPNIQSVATQSSPTELVLQRLSWLEENDNTAFYLPLLNLKKGDQTLFSLQGLNLKSHTSHSFLSKQEGKTWDAQAQQICLVTECAQNVVLSNEIQGLDKNALLDSQGDALVETIASLLFGNDIQVLSLKSVLTPNSEDTLAMHAEFPHGQASLDFNVKTSNLSLQKPLSQNLVASGVLKVPSQDLSDLLSSGVIKKSLSSPYAIQDTSHMTTREILSLIKQAWTQAGFISQEGSSELLILDFSPNAGLSLNHKSFSELDQAALYANVGNYLEALTLLNRSELQKNPVAEQMTTDILDIQKAQSEKTIISNQKPV